MTVLFPLVCGPPSTRQFHFFPRYFSQVYVDVLLPHSDNAQAQKKREKKEWQIKKMRSCRHSETLNCNILITLFLSLLMSNIAGHDDLRRNKRKPLRRRWRRSRLAWTYTAMFPQNTETSMWSNTHRGLNLTDACGGETLL